MIKRLEKYECRALLSHNYIGYLSYIFNNRPYTIPITYYYDKIRDYIIGYSGNGQKIKAMRNNNSVSLQVAEINSVNHWKSVLVHGIYREFQGNAAQINLHRFSEGVKEIVKNIENKNLHYISEFSSKIYKEGLPIVFQIEIEDLTGKERNF
ncbi:pyridoxamine 5'-phosphate oxidase family protein [Flavivirga eckloniae]|uniref:Flavin mononucleotide-binding protein n=1 Tax=Flavivirga eckloniae TaxID=1803846 RepID=A0A2K9PW84_9FLAO|nr:pyridoxamine 5'-phosphate oxidase family protein [Flavivirga eckloniae]AUP81326.1 flavin mononucleotide-binding protein [Flavivirga eckloniae]